MKSFTKYLKYLLAIIILTSSAFWLTVFTVNILDAKAAGKKFAQHKTIGDCVKAVTLGDHVCTSTSCFLENRYFYQSCMDHAKKSSAFCSTIPSFKRLLSLELWKKEKCESLNRTDRACGHIFLKAMQQCK